MNERQKQTITNMIDELSILRSGLSHTDDQALERLEAVGRHANELYRSLTGGGGGEEDYPQPPLEILPPPIDENPFPAGGGEDQGLGEYRMGNEDQMADTSSEIAPPDPLDQPDQMDQPPSPSPSPESQPPSPSPSPSIQEDLAQSPSIPRKTARRH